MIESPEQRLAALVEWHERMREATHQWDTFQSLTQAHTGDQPASAFVGHIGPLSAPGVTALVQETGHHGAHGRDCDGSCNPVMPHQCQKNSGRQRGPDQPLCDPPVIHVVLPGIFHCLRFHSSNMGTVRLELIADDHRGPRQHILVLGQLGGRRHRPRMPFMPNLGNRDHPRDLLHAFK